MGCPLGRTLFVGKALGFALFLLAFFATLLGFYNVVAQFTFGAEQAAIGNGKFRFLFFFRHKKLAIRF
jgi:hypothetical protein